MYLSNIRLWNFRCYGQEEFKNEIDLSKPNLDLSFNDKINVLVGENDSGKTAIIDAIRIVLRTQEYDWYRIADTDFYSGANRFRIELRFDDLSDDEAKNFIEWLSYEKKENNEEAKVYLRLIYDVKRNDVKIFPSDVCAGSDENGRRLIAEARDFLKTTYLKPLRDAASELSPGRYSRLASIFYSSSVFNFGRNKTDLQQNINDFNDSVLEFFSNDEKDGHKIKQIIDGYLKGFIDSERESEIIFSSTDLKNILSKLELEIKEAINPGLGTLNRLFMAAELLNLRNDNYEGLRLCLIEELEAHLHPQAQMKVVERLYRECEKAQLILTTHSPNLASKIKIENLILCHNSKCYPLAKEYTKLEENHYVFLKKFLDVTKANLFFAKGLIFVEGWSEQLFLPSFAEFLKEKEIAKKNLTEAGVSIINVAGTSFLEYVKIFQRKNGDEIDIPVAIITDSDVRQYKFSDDKKTVESIDDDKINGEYNEKLERAKGEYDYGNTIKVFLAKNWTFEFALYKSSVFSNAFQESVVNVHNKMKRDGKFEEELAKKLLSGTLKKTDIAYDLIRKFDDGDFSNVPRAEIEKDDSISYLVEAIKFVCR